MKQICRKGILCLVLGLCAVSAHAQPRTAQIAGIRGATPLQAENPELCADGTVKDDGTIETGYGWVPSVVDGQYVQELLATDTPSRLIEEVCVCWLRTRADDSIDFDVVFYGRDAGGGPEPTPYTAVAASAAGVPATASPDLVGRFYSVDVSDVHLRPGINYIGVRWDASRDPFFFVCTDTTTSTPPVEVFFIDDRANGWASVFTTSDPIFAAHRAILVRVRAAPFEVPVLGTVGLVLLATVLAVAGLLRLRAGR